MILDHTRVNLPENSCQAASTFEIGLWLLFIAGSFKGSEGWAKLHIGNTDLGING